MVFGQEVYGELEENQAKSVIKDMLDQLTELSKRYLNIKVMIDTELVIEATPLREFDPEERVKPFACHG